MIRYLIPLLFLPIQALAQLAQAAAAGAPFGAAGTVVVQSVVETLHDNVVDEDDNLGPDPDDDD